MQRIEHINELLKYATTVMIQIPSIDDLIKNPEMKKIIRDLKNDPEIDFYMRALGDLTIIKIEVIE